MWFVASRSNYTEGVAPSRHPPSEAVTKSYDVIVIGAGHNGLVTAAYLARAGYKTCVIERRGVVGGACVTEEVWPGYKVSTLAYVNSLFRPEIIRDLELKKHGFAMLPRNPRDYALVFAGETAALRIISSKKLRFHPANSRVPLIPCFGWLFLIRACANFRNVLKFSGPFPDHN